MIDELNTALREYQAKWDMLLASRADTAFFASVKPISIGWKVADLATFDTFCSQLRSVFDQGHMIYKNERWLGTFHLKDQKLLWDIELVGVMQRRPGSEDALGLDNVNFYCPDYDRIDEVLSKEPQLKWTHESCGPHSQWVSLWFGGTEVKLRPRSVLDVAIDEYKEIRDSVRSKIGV